VVALPAGRGSVFVDSYMHAFLTMEPALQHAFGETGCAVTAHLSMSDG
jgi:hypothetical protein